MKIVLIGFACCYKTTAGKLLSEKLNYKHIDVDRVIEDNAGKTVADIFATEGEQAFRKMENKALLSLTDCDNVVVSCGGGSALADGFNQLAKGSCVVWLTANADTVCARLGANTRPLFDGKSVEEIGNLIKARNAYYERYANLTVSTDGLTSRQVAEIVFDRLS